MKRLWVELRFALAFRLMLLVLEVMPRGAEHEALELAFHEYVRRLMFGVDKSEFMEMEYRELTPEEREWAEKNIKVYNSENVQFRVGRKR